MKLNCFYGAFTHIYRKAVWQQLFLHRSTGIPTPVLPLPLFHQSDLSYSCERLAMYEFNHMDQHDKLFFSITLKKTVNQLNDYIELSFCFPRTFLNSSRICFDLFFSLEKKHNIFYHSCPISNFLHKRTPWIQLLVS